MSSRIDNALSAMHFWATRPVGFLLVWITMTVAVVICVAWATATGGPKIHGATESSTTLTLTRQLGTRRAVAALILLVIFLVFYVATTLLWEDFTWYDNSLFTIGTLVGHNISPPIWPGEGRFFPLAFQEFNLLRHFTGTIAGYHLLPIIQLLIFAYILLILDDELAIAARVALVIVVLLTPGVWISFTELVLPERDVLFFLTCLVLAVKRFEEKRTIAWPIAAIISAQFMIYYKETAFLLLFGFAAGRLLLRVWKVDHAGWNYNRLWDKEGRFDLCLAVLPVLFLLFYFAVMGFGNLHYVDIRRQPRGEILFTYLKVDLLVWLFLAFVLGRIYLILRRRAAPVLLWDGLAFGAVSCFLGYAYLGMFSPYFLAPVDLIAVLYVGRFVVLSWNNTNSLGKVAASALAFTIVLQAVLLSTVVAFERKNIIHGTVEIARAVETEHRSHAGSALRLFFPFASPYRIMEFAAYLSSRGVPVEGAPGDAGRFDNVILATRTIDGDGPCMEWRSIRCHAMNGPHAGDLVIILPDDEASRADTIWYREQGAPRFFYDVSPPISKSLYPLIFDIASLMHVDKTLPDRWMHGCVTLWK